MHWPHIQLSVGLTVTQQHQRYRASQIAVRWLVLIWYILLHTIIGAHLELVSYIWYGNFWPWKLHLWRNNWSVKRIKLNLSFLLVRVASVCVFSWHDPCDSPSPQACQPLLCSRLSPICSSPTSLDCSHLDSDHSSPTLPCFRWEPFVPFLPLAPTTTC